MIGNQTCGLQPILSQWVPPNLLYLTISLTRSQHSTMVTLILRTFSSSLQHRCIHCILLAVKHTCCPRLQTKVQIIHNNQNEGQWRICVIFLIHDKKNAAVIIIFKLTGYKTPHLLNKTCLSSFLDLELPIDCKFCRSSSFKELPIALEIYATNKWKKHTQD